jgi:hypothetical protein
VNHVRSKYSMSYLGTDPKRSEFFLLSFLATLT